MERRRNALENSPGTAAHRFQPPGLSGEALPRVVGMMTKGTPNALGATATQKCGYSRRAFHSDGFGLPGCLGQREEKGSRKGAAIVRCC